MAFVDPQWDASFGYLHWSLPWVAWVDPQWDISFGYLHCSLPLVAWVDPQWDASFGYLHWVAPLRARWVRAWALTLSRRSTLTSCYAVVVEDGFYALALMCYSPMLLRAISPLSLCSSGGPRMISPSARSLWGSRFAALCIEASRSVFPTLAMLEWRFWNDLPICTELMGISLHPAERRCF